MKTLKNVKVGQTATVVKLHGEGPVRRRIMDMEVSSLKKKFKDKKFAAGCSRDVIRQGAENLGWELDVLMEKTIEAMRSCEESVNAACAAL